MFTVDLSEELANLRKVLERLDDVAMEALSEFIASRDPGDREAEKRIHRARRALAKAIAELDSTSSE